MNPPLSVVITNYWPTPLLERCTESLLAQPESREMELIVVCHGPDSAAERTLPASVKILRTTSESLSDARNLGWERAEGNLVAFIDDDAEADPTWMAKILGQFEDPGLMLLGGLDRPHPEDPAMARAARLQENFFRLHLLGLKSPSLRFKGANLIVRRNLLDRIGGFRGQGDYYGAEDTDLVDRALVAGCRIHFDPTLVVYHHGPGLRQILRKRTIEIKRGGTTRGLRTPMYAGVYLASLLLVALLLPALLLPYVILALIGWLALGVFILVTQGGRPRDLPGVLLVTGLEFVLLPFRGLAAGLKARGAKSRSGE